MNIYRQRFKSYEERLREKIVILPNGCHQWAGCKGPAGYGVFWMHSRRWLAHRASYELFVGAIPEGLELDHLCRNRMCVNPAHLEPVTHRENIIRGKSNVCKFGHPLAGGNLVPWVKHRLCLACKRRRDRESYARRTAAGYK